MSRSPPVYGGRGPYRPAVGRVVWQSILPVIWAPSWPVNIRLGRVCIAYSIGLQRTQRGWDGVGHPPCIESVITGGRHPRRPVSMGTVIGPCHAHSACIGFQDQDKFRFNRGGDHSRHTHTPPPTPDPPLISNIQSSGSLIRLGYRTMHYQWPVWGRGLRHGRTAPAQPEEGGRQSLCSACGGKGSRYLYYRLPDWTGEAAGLA